MSDEKKSEGQNPAASEEAVSDARRRLLRVGAYVAPAVLTSLTLSRRAWAGSPNPHCAPADPVPCGPPGMP